MAEEGAARVSPANGREQLGLTVGGKTLSIVVRDLLPILLLVSGLVGGYLIYQGMEHDLHLLYARQSEILARIREHEQGAQQLVERLHHMMLLHDYNMGQPAEKRLPLIREPY